MRGPVNVKFNNLSFLLVRQPDLSQSVSEHAAREVVRRAVRAVTDDSCSLHIETTHHNTRRHNPEDGSKPTTATAVAILQSF
jgi:hypothetical protein